MGPEPAELLRERGIQVTAQRLAVLRAVAGQPHATADAVAEAARAEIGAISLQSVYDALGVLVAEGLVRRIQPAGSAALFEARVGDNHHHLICRVCGRIVDVDCAVGSAPCLTAADDRGYEIDEAEVAYWGRCPECQARGDDSSGPDSPALRRRGRATAARAQEPTAQAPEPAHSGDPVEADAPGPVEPPAAPRAQAQESAAPQVPDPAEAQAPGPLESPAPAKTQAEAPTPRRPETPKAQAHEPAAPQVHDPAELHAPGPLELPAPRKAQAHEPAAAASPSASTPTRLEDRRPG